MTLSSVMLYNSFGHINFHEIKPILQGISTNIVVNNCRIQDILPSMIWVTRDFSQRSLNWKGKRLTDDEYFDMCLSNEIDNNMNNSNNNYNTNTNNSSGGEILFKSLFNRRTCICIPRPAEEDYQGGWKPNCGRPRVLCT